MTDTQNDTSELDAKTAQMDGDANSLNDLLKDVSTTDISIERKIHIVVCAMLGLDDEDHADDDEARPFEELLLALIAQREQAAELRVLARLWSEINIHCPLANTVDDANHAWRCEDIEDTFKRVAGVDEIAKLQATKPEKEG